MISAIEFGEKYRSCADAMIWRRSLPHGTTQAEAYLACQRGDWLIWQLLRNCVDYGEIKPALDRAVTKIVARAIRRSVKSLRGNHALWAKKYRDWARRWLSGEDRSRPSAITYAYAYAHAHAYAHSAADVAAAASSAAAATVDAYSDDYAAAAAAAHAAAYAAAHATTYASDHAVDPVTYAEAASSACRKELKLQACNIRSEIPIWQGRNRK